MTRVIGFSLKLEGSQKTVTELGNINTALGNVSSQIKKINEGGVLKPLFEDQAQFKSALQENTKVLKSMDTLLTNLGKGKNVDQSAIDALLVTIKKLKTEIEQLKVDLNNIKSPTINVASGDGLDKLKERAKAVNHEIMEIAPAFNALADGAGLKLLNQIAAIDIKLKQVKANIASTKADSGPDQQGNLTLLLAEEKALTNQKVELNKQVKDEISNFDKLGKEIDPTSIIGMRNELKRLKNEFLLMGEERKKSQEGLEKFARINVVNAKLNEAEQQIGDFIRNVGNYRDAVSSLLPTLEKLTREGKLTGNGLADAFRSEAFANVQKLEQEVTELAQAFDKLTKEEKEAEIGIQLFSKLTAKANELQGAMSKVPKETNRVKGSLISLGDLITGGLITGGLFALASSAKAFGAAAISEFTQAETALSKIKAQLTATGNVSGKTAEQLKALATKIEINVGIDGDQVLNEVTSNLLKFVRVQGEVFERAQTNAVDLAQVMGGDLAGATNLLGKALDNPIKGISLLNKAGIGLSEATQKQIKDAVKANDLYKAQGIILTEVEGRVKGVSGAIQNSDLQNLRAATVAWNNFKETVGGVIISITNSFFKLGKEISDGTLFTPVGLKITKVALDDLTESIVKETSALDLSFKALKDDNLSRESKKVIMDDLESKYGTLVSAEELEGATLEDLSRIQARLTEVSLQQVEQRVKAAAREASLTEIANKKIELAFLKRNSTEKSSFLDKVSVFFNAGGVDVNKVFEGLSNKVNTEIDQLTKELEDQEKILNDAFPTINTDKIKFTYEDAALKIKTVLGQTTKKLADPNITASAKKELQKIQLNFSGFKVDSTSTTEFINSIVKQSNTALSTIKSVTGKNIGLVDSLSDETKKAADTQAKVIDEQIKRLADLNEKIKGLKIESIDNEFIKKIEETKAKTQKEINQIESELTKLEGIKIKTGADETEISKLKELLVLLSSAEGKQIKIIEADQAKAVSEARTELIKLKSEIDQIINDGTKITIESQISTAQFDLGQENRTIELTYTTNLDQLKSDLANGLITQKEFDQEVYNLDKDKLDKQLEAAQNFKTATDSLYQALYDVQLKDLEIKDAQIRANIELERQANNLKAIEEGRKNGISQVVVDNTIVENNKKAKEAIIKQDNEFNAAENKLNNELKTNTQKSSDDIVEIQQKGYDKDAENAKAAKDKKINDQKELFETLKSQALSIAQQIADAIFEIDKEQIERQYNSRLEGAEREKAAQLKLHKGNAQEEDRINREFEIKKRVLEKQKFEENKKVAIEQAKINGALAALNALATSKNIYVGLVLAAGAAITTAIQISKIKQTTFAEGGFGHQKMFRKSGEGGFTGASQAPRDHTGKRPIGTATFHENEYTATEGQVNQNKDIFDIAEADRKAMQSGRSSQLRKNLYAALVHHETTPNIFTRSRKFDAPVLYQANYFRHERGNSEIKISEESIKSMSKTIAAEVHQSIKEGTQSGFREATEKIIQDQIRNTNLKKAV